MSKRAPLETKNKLRIRKSSTKGHFRKVWDVNIVGCKLHSGMRSALIFFFILELNSEFMVFKLWDQKPLFKGLF